MKEKRVIKRFSMYYGVLLIGVLLIGCKNLGDSKPKPDVGSSQDGVTAEILVDTNDEVDISPRLFGVDNDWRRITDANYIPFAQALEGINYTQIRFPGGWESEYYDWKENSTPGWPNTPEEPGASIGTVKSTDPPNINIVIPTTPAMNEVLFSPEWSAGIQLCKDRADDAINLTGQNNITEVEIGNEWWLQGAGGVSDEEKLIKYAEIAKRIAAHVKQTYPSAPFKLLVNGDYAKPSGFTVINEIFGEDLQYIDGAALHPYAGYDDPEYSIDSLSTWFGQCRQNLGKDYLHLSEWAPSKAYNDQKKYAQSANVLIGMVHEFARTGSAAATYWPPTNSGIPGLGLFNEPFTVVWPNGQLFRDLSANYKGKALLTTSAGNVRAIAAKNDQNQLVVYVAGFENPTTLVQLNVVGSTIAGVSSTKLFAPGNPDDTAEAIPMQEIDNPKYTKTQAGYEFILNENSGYTIYRLILDLGT
ncbi:MAG: hypothetical protein AAFX53_00590 [Bacteroidota bacterium]